jgi:hypothetical protein
VTRETESSKSEDEARRMLQNSVVAPDEALAALGTSRENASRSADCGVGAMSRSGRTARRAFVGRFQAVMSSEGPDYCYHRYRHPTFPGYRQSELIEKVPTWAVGKQHGVVALAF